MLKLSVIGATSAAMPVSPDRSHGWHPGATTNNFAVPANFYHFAKAAKYGKCGTWSSIG